MFNNSSKEYPFELELYIEKEIKNMNLEGVYNLIDTNKLRYNDVRDTIQEMIFVLSRTVLRDLEDLKLISYLRNKYNKNITCRQ